MRYKKYILLAALVAFVGATGWFFKSELEFWFDRTQSDEIGGLITLSLRKESDQNNVTNPYVIDLSQKLQRQPKKLNNFPGYSLERAGLEISNTFYAVSASEESVGMYPDDPVAVHKINFSTESSRILTDNSGFNERHVAWSDSLEKVAYAFQSKVIPESEAWNIKTWNIAIFDIKTDEEIYIENAAYPQWLPEQEKMLYLSTKGLYSYDLNTNESLLVKAIPNDDEVFTMESMYSISKDGKYLIWSTPGRGQITIFDVNITENLVSLKNPVNHFLQDHKVYSPILSPDNQYYALHSVSKSDVKNSVENVSIFNAKTGLLSRSYSLDSFDSDAVFIELWENN